VGINDVFFETDTAKYYVFNGVAWSVSNSKPPMRGP